MSREDFIEKNQNFASNLLFGLLVWVFGVAVFLPMASTYVPEWGSIIAIILIVVLTYFLFSAIKSSKPFFEYFSEMVANYYYNKWRKIDNSDKEYTYKVIKKTLKISLLILLYIIYRPLLWVANPVLAGITLIIILLLIISQIFSKQ